MGQVGLSVPEPTCHTHLHDYPGHVHICDVIGAMTEAIRTGKWLQVAGCLHEANHHFGSTLLPDQQLNI